MINLIGKIQIALATSAERLGNIPLLAEPVWDTDENYLFVGDGVTYGGVRIGGDVNEIEANIALLFQLLGEEVTNRTNADNALGVRIDEEIADRIAGDEALQAALDAVETSITDALAAETAARIAADNAIGVRIDGVESDLADEVTARQAADTTLQTNINNEATARTAADTALGVRIDGVQSDLSDEADAREAADAALGVRVDDETSARIASDETLQDNIDAEAATRSADDTALSNRIDAETTARTAADTQLQTNITAEATARGNADTQLQTNINNEATARQGADTALGLRIDGVQSDLADEVLALTAVDASLSYRIDTEVSDREAADTALGVRIDELTTDSSDALAAETAARTAADLVLQGNITTEETARIAADTTLQTNINTEATTRGNADTALGVRIDGVESDLADEVAARTAADTATNTRITNLTKADIGLGNVDNTSDAAKPISTATQTALNTKADAVWIDAELRNIKDGLELKVDEADLAPVALSGVYADLTGKPTLGTAASQNSTAFATAAQGVTADTALQPGDNVSELVNDAGYTTNVGTVTSVNIAPNTASTGLVVSGGPVSTSGTFTLTLDTGVQKYTTTEANKLAGIAAGAQVNTVTSVAGKTGAVTLAKADVGLGNVDNTADSAKPVSTAQQTALNAKYNRTGENQLTAYDQTTPATVKAILDGGDGSTRMPGVVFPFGSFQVRLLRHNTALTAHQTITLPIGNGSLVLDAPSDGQNYVRVDGSWTVLPEDAGTVSSVNGKIGDVVLVKADIGLGNVDNTSDANKPISTATQTALNGKQATFGNQTQNFVYAGPATGTTAGAPVFRALAVADIPSLSSLYVIVGRTVTAGTGLTGGGDLSANRSIALSTASITSLALADTAVQPGALATVATTGSFTDLTNRPTTLTGYGITDGVISTRTITAGTGLTGGGNLTANRTVALSATSIASLALADTSLQPSSIGTNVQPFNSNLTAWSGIAVADKANSATTLTAGNGLTGGGSLAANRTITLATPGALSDTTINEATATGHTHQITGFLPLAGGIITGNLSVNGAMGVGTRLTLPEIQLVGTNADTNFRISMISTASYAYIQAGNPANVGNTAGKLRFTGWLGTSAEEIRFDSSNVNVNGNTIMTVAGGTFTGAVNGTTATFTGDTKTPIGTTIVSADTTVTSAMSNGIIKKTVTTPVILTLPANIGRDGDVITIVNGGNSGNINIVGSGITMYLNGAVVSTIVVVPKASITIIRDNGTSWIA